MHNTDPRPSPTDARPDDGHSQCVEWYHEGQSRIVEAHGVRIEVRFIGRKGRRGRIAIIAPQGAAFQAVERAPCVASAVAQPAKSSPTPSD